jgi:hypothetical protein
MTPAPTPLAEPYLVRLGERQYQNAIAVLFGGRAHRTPAPVETVWPFAATASGDDRYSTFAATALTDLDVLRLSGAAGAIAKILVDSLRARGSCQGIDETFVVCLRALVSEKGALLFGRPLTADETGLYVDRAERARSDLGDEGGASVALQSLLVAPQFLFVHALGPGLSSYERATAMALALTDWPPDPDLFAAAASGTLNDPSVLRAQALRLVDAEVDHPTGKHVRFLREHFGYAGATGVFKEAALLGHEPEALIESTDRFAADVLMRAGRSQFVRTLLTAPTSFVDQLTYRSYDLPTYPDYDGFRKTDQPGQRAGMLTQPAMLVARSTSTRNQPVQRGRFVREQLLCQPVPSLTIGRPPDLGSDGDLPLRESLERHRADPACAGCHTLMDPLGLAFEIYDDLGRRRTDAATDASGVLAGAGDSDGPFRDALDLATRLGSSPVVESCFFRNTFTFFVGRAPDGARDQRALAATVTAYRRAGSYTDALATLVTALLANEDGGR